MIKRVCYLIILVLISCQNTSVELIESAFYIGTYTNAESKGIYSAAIDADGKFDGLKLVANTENPSFLAKSKEGQYLVAVNETTQNSAGAITSFAVKKDSVIVTGSIPSEGANPCHVTITKDNYVITSNYSGGNIVLSKLQENGALRYLDSSLHDGSTDHLRQEGPHVHSTWIHPRNGDIIALDLGTNELWFYTIDRETDKLKAKDQKKLRLPDGAGPRHLAFHPSNPDWIYVLNELNATVSLVKLEKNGYKLQNTIGILPSDFKDYNASADIHISRDGQFLYASNRGHNSIAILKINLEDGSLSLVDIQKIPGSWPRNFTLSLDDKYLIYANKWTNNIFSLKRDAEKGTLQVVDSIAVPSPVMILF